MSSLLHPVGPEPPAVYWFRRAMVLAVVLGLVVVVVLLTGPGGQADDRASAAAEPAGAGADDGAAPQPTGGPATTSDEALAAAADEAPAVSPSESATASPTASPTTSPAVSTAAAAPCGEALGLTVSADADSYPADAVPRLTLSIRNGGQAACTVDVGSREAVELVVTSGEDRIWSSDDCQPAAEARVVTLEPGAEDVQSVSWQRGRSAEGCPTGLPEPEPGTYQVTARAGEVTSEPVTFVLE